MNLELFSNYNAQGYPLQRQHDNNNDGTIETTITHTPEYNTEGQLIKVIEERVDSYAPPSSRAYIYSYSAVGLLEQEQEDEGNDGTIEYINNTFYEQADCSPGHELYLPYKLCVTL